VSVGVWSGPASAVSTWSLVSGALPILLALAATAGVAWLLSGRRAPGFRVVAACAVGAVVITAAGAYLVRSVWRLIPDPLGVAVYSCVGVGLFVILLAVVQAFRWRGPGRTAAVAIAAAVAVAACANQINLIYDAYPTVGAALGTQRLNEIPFSEVTAPNRLRPDHDPVAAGWTAPPGLPAAGRLTHAAIPGTTSGFHARPAEIYLPPAYFADPRPQLPVLVLLAGQPGSPTGSVRTCRSIPIRRPGRWAGCPTAEPARCNWPPGTRRCTRPSWPCRRKPS
jgi:hypothetical protein